MKNNIFILGFILSCISLRGQEPVLKFQSGRQYQIYFVDVSVEAHKHESIDSIRNGFVRWDDKNSFLINDKTALDNLQTSWIGKRSDAMYFCWYDYFLYVVEDNQLVDELRVNEECKQVVCKHNIFNYSTPIATTIDKSKTIAVAKVNFDSLSVGRQFLEDIKKESDIFVSPGEHDEWIRFDGKMTISTSRGDSHKIKAKLDREIQKQFPNETFEIQESGSGAGHLWYDIYCSIKLGKTLTGYEIFMDWLPLDPTVITLFSAKRSSIENQLKKYAR